MEGRSLAGSLMSIPHLDGLNNANGPENGHFLALPEQRRRQSRRKCPGKSLQQPRFRTKPTDEGLPRPSEPRQPVVRVAGRGVAASAGCRLIRCGPTTSSGMTTLAKISLTSQPVAVAFLPAPPPGLNRVEGPAPAGCGTGSTHQKATRSTQRQRITRSVPLAPLRTASHCRQPKPRSSSRWWAR